MDWKGCTNVVEIKVAVHVLYTQTSSKRTRAGVRRGGGSREMTRHGLCLSWLHWHQQEHLDEMENKTPSCVPFMSAVPWLGCSHTHTLRDIRSSMYQAALPWKLQAELPSSLHLSPKRGVTWGEKTTDLNIQVWQLTRHNQPVVKSKTC